MIHCTPTQLKARLEEDDSYVSLEECRLILEILSEMTDMKPFPICHYCGDTLTINPFTLGRKRIKELPIKDCCKRYYARLVGSQAANDRAKFKKQRRAEKRNCLPERRTP